VRIWFALFATSTVAAVACGARSGLFPAPELDLTDGGALADAGHDATVPPIDAGDSGPDVIDAQPDVIPDAAPDVAVDNCQDAGITYIYLIGRDNELLRFDPSSLTATTIGTISCPDDTVPYSMAVDRLGIAYVVFEDGQLFRVSTATASCAATAFQVGQGGFSTVFGMGFSSDTADPGETLFIAGNISMQLATLDPTTFTVTPVGTFSTAIGAAELTGTGTGELYAFGLVVDGGMTAAVNLAQIDKSTAQVITNTSVSVASGSAQIFDWAFAYWGGDFYFFTSSDGATTIVSRYQPGGTLALPVVATLGSPIVGAGVSTCAPHP
jgi:hypothetical protein